MDTKIKNTAQFTIVQRKKEMKFLGANITKHSQYVYAENYEMLMK